MEIQMLKVKNANKVILFVSFVLFNIHCFSQNKLSGVYFRDYAMNDFYSQYEFKANNIFEYHSGGDLGKSEYGKGHYYIKNDSLILNYNLTKLEEESYHRTKKFYNSKDSIRIKLKILDFRGNPLSNIQVWSFPDYKSTSSNEKGETELTFEKSKKELEIHVDGQFLDKHTIFLKKENNYCLNVYMNKSKKIGFSHPKAVKGDILKFKILKIDNNSFKIKNKDKKVITWIKQKE